MTEGRTWSNRVVGAAVLLAALSWEAWRQAHDDRPQAGPIE